MSKFDTLKQKAADLKANLKKLQEEMVEEVKPLLQEFIHDTPEVKGLCVIGFVPYFNDGDTCEYSLHEPCFYFFSDDNENFPCSNEVGEDHWDHELWWDYDKADVSFKESVSKEVWQKCRDFASMISGLEDEFRLLFGDHAKIIITREGVEVEEYDHD